MVYQISKVFLALIYTQHRHMIYGELHIHHYLVLGKNKDYNYYSTPLRHEVWNMDRKMVILVIALCYNIFSLICVKNQHHPEHDTLYL